MGSQNSAIAVGPFNPPAVSGSAVAAPEVKVSFSQSIWESSDQALIGTVISAFTTPRWSILQNCIDLIPDDFRRTIVFERYYTEVDLSGQFYRHYCILRGTTMDLAFSYQTAAKGSTGELVLHFRTLDQGPCCIEVGPVDFRYPREIPSRDLITEMTKVLYEHFSLSN